MSNTQAKRDDNFVPVSLGVDDTTGETKPFKVDGTGRLLVSATLSGVTVANGGTGVTSFTAYAPIFGGTTSTGALQSGTVGSSGEVLTSNGAGVLPTFQAAASAGANTALSNLASVAINTSLLPGTDDGAALGSGTKEFSDLFLASGGVINFANGDVTLTHSADLLTLGGGGLSLNGNTLVSLGSTTFISGAQIKTAVLAGNTLQITARDVDGASNTPFITLTANNTPTCDLDDTVTKAGAYIYRAGGTDVPITDGGTGASDAATAFGNLKQAATTSATGVVELAITSEIDTGTDSTRAMPVDQFVASTRNIRFFDRRVLDSATSQTTGTTVGGDFELPFTGTIVSIGAYVDTAGTTNLCTVDVNLNGSTIMTANKITIDSTEKTSRTAATPPALTTTAVTVGDILTIDVDAIQTTPAKGLTVRFGIRLT